jgi:hypothetical protein
MQLRVAGRLGGGGGGGGAWRALEAAADVGGGVLAASADGALLCSRAGPLWAYGGRPPPPRSPAWPSFAAGGRGGGEQPSAAGHVAGGAAAAALGRRHAQLVGAADGAHWVSAAPHGEPWSPGGGGFRRGLPGAVVAVASGPDFALAAAADGALYSWGAATLHQLGHGSDAPERAPRRVDALRGAHVHAAAAGPGHAVALADGGSRVFGWGDNRAGQLGPGPARRIRPGEPLNLPRPLHRGEVVVHAACAAAATLLATSRGTLFVLGDLAGDPAAPRLAVLPLARPLVALAAGSFHAAAIDDSGALLVWGAAADGQLGLADELSEAARAPARAPVTVRGLPPLAAVACGFAFSLVLVAA